MRGQSPRHGRGSILGALLVLATLTALPIAADQPRHRGDPSVVEAEARSPSGGLAIAGSLTRRSTSCRRTVEALVPTEARGGALEIRGTVKTSTAIFDSCCGCGTVDDPIFSDGFETGDTSAWTATNP